MLAAFLGAAVIVATHTVMSVAVWCCGWAVLRCTVLCCAVLCCATLCCAFPCSASPHFSGLLQDVLPKAALSFVVNGFPLQIACGLDHTLALSQSGQAYAFGDNSLCQLGRTGSKGLLGPNTVAADWVIRDEDREIIHFTKVA